MAWRGIIYYQQHVVAAAGAKKRQSMKSLNFSVVAFAAAVEVDVDV